MTTTTPTADDSTVILTDYLARREPFFFVRYGDGALECIFEPGEKHNTCDGEVYTPELSRELLNAWAQLETSEHTVFAGDWQSASFGGRTGTNRELDRWSALTDGARFTWIHFEALLLMRESAALVGFYRAVRSDRRRKVYVGPAKNAAAARFLQARHLITPMVPNLITRKDEFSRAIDCFEPDVVLYGAGMAGNVIAVDSWLRHRDRTYISLGSALDPLFGDRTRAQQLNRPVLRQMFRGML